MTNYHITVGKALLLELLSSQDGLAKLIENVLNQVLEA
jgi:putative transposase